MEKELAAFLGVRHSLLVNSGLVPTIGYFCTYISQAS